MVVHLEISTYLFLCFYVWVIFRKHSQPLENVVQFSKCDGKKNKNQPNFKSFPFCPGNTQGQVSGGTIQFLAKHLFARLIGVF